MNVCNICRTYCKNILYRTYSDLLDSGIGSARKGDLGHLYRIWISTNRECLACYLAGSSFHQRPRKYIHQWWRKQQDLTKSKRLQIPKTFHIYIYIHKYIQIHIHTKPEDLIRTNPEEIFHLWLTSGLSRLSGASFTLFRLEKIVTRLPRMAIIRKLYPLEAKLNKFIY